MANEYCVQVYSQKLVTPHLRRVELCGEALSAFPRDQESGYVKLVLPSAEGGTVLRSYTVRQFDATENRLVLDFVDHVDVGAPGPACAWARSCQRGDEITFRGPGEKKLADPEADWFLLAGDLSALPALSVNLQRLPAHATGYAVIEVPDAADIQALPAPPGIEVRWLVNDDATSPNQRLVEEVLSLEWRAGRAYPWFAGEFDAMRRLRSYFRDERGIDRRQMYVSSYWKLGDSDEGMKKAKRLDAEMDAQQAAAIG